MRLSTVELMKKTAVRHEVFVLMQNLQHEYQCHSQSLHNPLHNGKEAVSININRQVLEWMPTCCNKNSVAVFKFMCCCFTTVVPGIEEQIHRDLVSTFKCESRSHTDYRT